MSQSTGGHATTLRVVFTVVLLVVSSTVAAVPVTADNTGELTVDVEHQNGNDAQEVNALIIYQDGKHYETVTNYPSVDLEHTFDGLPTGHKYTVNAYVHDHLAGSVTTKLGTGGFMNEPSSKSKTITVQNPVRLKPTVYYNDGETGLSGATVRVKSHQDDPNGDGKVVWRSATTTDDGTTDPSPLWLYPSEADDPGYYTVEAVVDGAVVASRQLDSLTSETALELVTSESVPTYDLSASSTDGGDVSTSPGGAVKRGETVTVTATPEDGYKFDHWSGDYPEGSRTSQQFSVVMDGDRSVTAHFERQTGDLTVDVRHENGDRAGEVNALVVWQDEVGGEPFRTFENYPSVAIRQKINDLPGGHEYKVTAYIHDQYAGATGWIEIDDSDVRRTIRVDDPVAVTPRVYYNDGQTPLAGATVRVKSHQDDPNGDGKVVWRSATTTDDGTTDPSPLWLYPAARDRPGYYTVEAVVDGEVVASERLDSLTGNRTVTLVTDEAVPTNEVWFTVSKQSSMDGYEFSGETISGAKITVDGQTKQTNGDGKVSFDLPAGTYEYTASADGFETLTGSIEVSESGALAVSVPLTRTGAGVLELDVLGRDGDTLAANKYRVLVDGDRVKLNADGEVVLDEGRHTVTVKPTEFGADEGVTEVKTTVRIKAGRRTRERLTAVGANRPSMNAVSVEVRSMNGNDRGWNGFDVGPAIEEMRVKLTGPDGQPVTAETVRLGVEDTSRSYTLTHAGDGVYTLADRAGGVFADTEYTRFTFSYPDGSGQTSVTVPTVSDQYGLRAPIEGWVAYGSARVTVDGEEYVGVKLLRDGDYENDVEGWAETAWIVFDADGRLVTDPELRRKAALTAMVARSTRRNSEWMTDFLKREYPNTLERQLQYARIGSGLVLVRDTAAELLGTVGGAVVTGGGNIVSKTTVKGAVKATAKQLSKDVLTNYLKSQIPGSEIRSNPLGAIQKALKLKASAEVRDAAAESREAGRILERHSNGQQWDYESARKFYESKNESVTDGVLYTEIRLNMLPSGDPKDQLVSITKSVATGATGVPVNTLTSLIEGGQMGYISESVNDTARTRAVAALEARSFRRYGEEAQRQARSTYENRVLYSAPGETVTSARISLVEAPSGRFTEGERANATVEVTNTGDTPGRFFVGYSVGTTVDGDRRYFDNHGTTGHFVELAPGESVTTEVSWTVQSSAPTGQRYDTLVAVWPEFPAAGVQPYQTREETDTFRVTDGTSFETTGVSVAADSPTVGESQEIVTDVRNTGSADGSTVVNLSVDGTVVDQRLVSVAAGDERTVVFEHTFERAGTHTVESGGASTTVSVADDAPAPSVDVTATPPTATAGERIRLTASASGGDGGLSFEWTQIEGPAVELTDADTATPEFVAPEARATVTFRVTVDDGTETAAETVSVEVTPGQPTASFLTATATPTVGEPVTFDAAGSTAPTGRIDEYRWDFDGDGSTDATGQTVKTTFETAGERRVRLTVVAAGATQSTTRTVTVAPADETPPTAALTAPQTATVGEAITVDAGASTDPDGEIVEYRFDTDGDGQPETTTDRPTAEVTFDEAGSYTVSVTVEDGDGANRTATTNVTVTAATDGLTAVRSLPAGVQPGETVQVTVRVPVDGEVTGLGVDEQTPLPVVRQRASPQATFREGERQWLFVSVTGRTAVVNYTVRVPEDAEPGTEYTFDGNVSSSSVDGQTVGGDTTLVVRQCPATAVAGDDGELGLREIQQAIGRWADSEAVAGESLGLTEIQRLIGLWADDDPVACGG